jgi:hypothetical protein
LKKQTMKHFVLPALFSISVFAGWGVDAARAGASAPPAFRVRSDFAAGLNADQGWAGAPNENVTIYADRPFRVRFEVERSPESHGSQQFRLQYRRNAGTWTDVEAHDFPHPNEAGSKTPRVSIVSCIAFKNGAATTNLLSGSAAGFRAGAGLSLADRTPPWTAAGAHGEFEWALVVRRFADGAVTNEPGDTFELRMVEAGGAARGAQLNPVLRFAVPPGHVGGTFVETPGRIGPWRAANGDLYFIMEPAETSNLFMMIKSTDHGASLDFHGTEST